MATKADVVSVVAEANEITKKYAGQIVGSVFNAVRSLCEAEGRVAVKGFGIFKIKNRAAKKGRNPQTGETLTIAAKTVMIFKQPSK